MVVACALLAGFNRALVAQANDTSPLKLVIGTLRTEAERSGVRLVASFAKEISGTDFQGNQKSSFWFFTPDIKIQTGDNDAFNGVIAKATGSLVLSRRIHVDENGNESDDTSLPVALKSDAFHTFPFSAGFETDRAFRSVNGLVEVGYVPWFQGIVPSGLKSLHIGVFAQAGYKAEIDTSGAGADAANVGSTDQSEEGLNEGIVRFKGSARWAPNFMGKKDGFRLGARGETSGWYDALNRSWYHRIEATIRIGLAEGKDFELTYENGSGAPNFNQGEQFSANLAISF
jgi:hypothetical protein